MMMQESPGAAGIGNISSADQFAGRFKDQQRSKINPTVEDQVLKCPRCDSPNTKFCYYNNYNLTQPRHFCKTCRRYWTKGGALRNVPIGGGCRKNKRPKQRAAASKDQNPLMIALDHHHHHRHPNPNPHHHHHPHPQHGEESSSPAAMDVPSNLSVLHNIWGASNSNYLDLPSAETVGLALAKLQNRPSLLGPAVMPPESGVNADRRPYSHPGGGGGHMATLMYETPSAILPSPSSSSAAVLAEGVAAASSNFCFAGAEPNFGSVAEDLMQWRIQQQSRLAVLQQHLPVDGNSNHNNSNSQNHSHASAHDNNIDAMLISSANDQNYESRPADHRHQQKGKSIMSSDLQAEWPAVADCLFEPHAVVAGESTSGYWYGLQQLAEN